jgi:hypothetical protein
MPFSGENIHHRFTDDEYSVIDRVSLKVPEALDGVYSGEEFPPFIVSIIDATDKITQFLYWVTGALKKPRSMR